MSSLKYSTQWLCRKLGSISLLCPIVPQPPRRGPHCGARALRPSSPNLLPHRLTFVTLLLTRIASARACRVGTTHMAKWTADPWAFHCSCAVTVCIVCIVNGQFRISGTSIYKGHAKIVDMSPVMSDPHVTISTHY